MGRMGSVSVLVIFVIGAVLPIAPEDKVPLLPKRILESRTVAIRNDSGKPRAPKKAAKEIAQWGRFKLVSLTENPDLIFALWEEEHKTVRAGGASATVNGPFQNDGFDARYEYRTTMAVFDGKSHQLLWSIGFPQSRVTVFRITDNPVKELRKILEKQEEEDKATGSLRVGRRATSSF